MKNDTSYYPGCHLSSAGKRNPHQICEHLKETLESRRTVENLHKELERRETRNDRLMKELHSVRNTLQLTENELRSLKGTFDHTKIQHNDLVAELGESKEYAYKLEIQVSKMRDAGKLMSELQQTRSDVKRLYQDIEQKKLEVSVSEEKIATQQKEIETLNRSLDACVFYQGSRKAALEGSPSGEKMRAIYYELGKRQADIRAISLSLSQTQSDLIASTNEKMDLEGRVSYLENLVAELRNSNEKYVEQNAKDGDTIARLSDENNCADQDIKRLQKEVELLSAQLEGEKVENQRLVKQKDSEVDVLSEAVLQHQEENQKLKERLDSLNLSVRQKESVHALTEQRFRSELRRLEEERRLLQSYLNDGEHSAEETQKLRASLSEALSSNETLVRESQNAANAHRHATAMLQQIVDRSESDLISLRKELRELRQEYEVVLSEREEAAGALRRAIEMAKGLSAKVTEEQVKREEAENKLALGQKRMQDILRAKEQVSYAVLDALHKERALQTSVSRTLTEMRKRDTEEDHPNSLNTSRDSLNGSYTKHGDVEDSFAGNEPNSGRDISPEKAVSHDIKDANISASNTPKPRSPLSGPSVLGQGTSDTDVGYKRPQTSPLLSRIPGSPEHLDLGQPGTVKHHLIGDLKRLRQEVAVLDIKSKEISANSGSEISGSPSTPERRGISEVSRVRDELSETHRYTSSPLYSREMDKKTIATETSVVGNGLPAPPTSKSSASASHQRDRVEHSLFDILNMDPREDFADSPSTKFDRH